MKDIINKWQEWGSKIWQWGVKHKFHFLTLILISLLGSGMAAQQTMIMTLKLQLNSKIDTVNDDINTKMEHMSEKLNARIDTLDNTVNIEEKRKALVINIRKAITEDIGRNLGARDLNRIANAVIDYSYQYDLTIPQVLAQIRVESNYNNEATSKAGAQGLMQIMPGTLKTIRSSMSDAPSVLNVFNVHHNIKAGCYYMSEQIRDFGSYEQALMAYNWGPDNVRRYNAGEIKDVPLETQQYVPRVLEKIEFYKRYGLH